MKRPDMREAIRVYHQYDEIGNKEMREIFGPMGNDTISKLKKLAVAVMNEKGIRPWSANKVKTDCAFKAWNIDVNDLEARVRKLNKLAESGIIRGEGRPA